MVTAVAVAMLAGVGQPDAIADYAVHVHFGRRIRCRFARRDFGADGYLGQDGPVAADLVQDVDQMAQKGEAQQPNRSTTERTQASDRTPLAMDQEKSQELLAQNRKPAQRALALVRK
jgi:hypothetical protein